MTTRMEAQWCPTCFHRLDANSQIVKKGERPAAEATPDPGDVTICIECGSILVFDDAMKLYAIENADNLPPSLRSVLLAVQEAVKTIGPRPKTQFWRM
jgi:hypothetical protein